MPVNKRKPKGKPTEKFTALSAAQRMTKERGYVVIGIPADERAVVEVGTHFTEFAWQSLPGHCLVATSRTTRGDWDSQTRAIFGSLKYDTNQYRRGDRYFRCALRERPVIKGTDAVAWELCPAGSEHGA